MEYRTKTGVLLTVIEGSLGKELPDNTLESMRDQCRSLHFTLESIRNTISEALTMKQLIKFQSTFSKSHELRTKSLPKRFQASYIEAEATRLELVKAQDALMAYRESLEDRKAN